MMIWYARHNSTDKLCTALSPITSPSTTGAEHCDVATASTDDHSAPARSDTVWSDNPDSLHSAYHSPHYATAGAAGTCMLPHHCFTHSFYFQKMIQICNWQNDMRASHWLLNMLSSGSGPAASDSEDRLTCSDHTQTRWHTGAVHHAEPHRDHHLDHAHPEHSSSSPGIQLILKFWIINWFTTKKRKIRNLIYCYYFFFPDTDE